ncbi:MAG: hypothetical protein U0411_03920 [Thermodesulfovibrionales bacterium]
METMREYLERAGFAEIQFIGKENSEEIIRSWNFGAGVEKVVFSLYIKAVKPAEGPLSRRL